MNQYRLIRDKKICKMCGSCSKLLPDFILIHDGILLISESNYKQEHVKLAADSIIDTCSENAIKVVKTVC